MPFTQNGYYNNPVLGQAFSNIASLFAPPSFQEQLAAKTLQQNQAAAQFKQNSIGKLNSLDPTGMLAALYGAGDSDAVAHWGKALAIKAALADPNDPAALDGLNTALAGTGNGSFAMKQMEPLSEGQTRILTPATATTLGVPQQQAGVISADKRKVIFPNGQLPTMAANPPPTPSDDDTNAPAIPPPAGTPAAAAATPGGAAPVASGGQPVTSGTAPFTAGADAHPVTAGIVGTLNAQNAAAAPATPAPLMAAPGAGPIATSIVGSINARNAATTPASASSNGVSVSPNGIVTIDAPEKGGTTNVAPADYPQYGIPAGTPGPVQVDSDGKLSFPMRSGQTINVSDKAAQSYTSGAMDALAQSHYALVNGVPAAQSQLRDMNAMSGALDRIQAAGGVTGLGTTEKTQLQGLINTGAASLGITEPFDVTDPQVIAKFNRTLAGQQAKDVGGARVTNFELNNFLSSNPGLELTPNANKTLLGIQSQIAQRNIDLGTGIRNYYAQSLAAKQEPDPGTVEKMITAYDGAHHITDPVTGQDLTQNPTLPGLQSTAAQQPGAAPVQTSGPMQLRSVDEYNALPSGTQYVAPGETQVRIKR